MKKIFISLSMLALGFMTSCQQEVLFNEASQVESSLEFTASLEGKATSRTQLSPLDEKNNIYKVLWSEKDALSVHESENSHARYIIKKGVGTVCGTFRWAGGDMIAGTESWNGDSKMYVGVYPYSDATTIEKNEKGFRIYTEIPTVQTFAEGSCGENALPMVAVCKDYDFAFKNVGAIIILPLKGETKIASATLESKAHKIAGKAIVTANKEDKWIPTIDVTNGENKVVRSQRPMKRITNKVGCKTKILVDSKSRKAMDKHDVILYRIAAAVLMLIGIGIILGVIYIKLNVKGAVL
jgi:hypothetical protein